jgi:hypothetical protein
MRYRYASLAGLLLGVMTAGAIGQPTQNPAGSTGNVPNRTAAPVAPTRCPPAPGGTASRSPVPNGATAMRTPSVPRKPAPGGERESPCR